MADEAPRDFRKSKYPVNYGSPVWTPAGRLLFRIDELVEGRRKYWLMSLDLKSFAIEQIAVPKHVVLRVLACPDESQVLLLVDSTIQRYRWGKNGGELLFPRPGSRRLDSVTSVDVNGGEDR